MKKSLISFAFILQVITLTAQDVTSAQSKGNQIGEVIKAAIETAVPAIGTLMNLIWPKKPDNSDKTTATKSEIQTALEAEKEKWKNDMKNGMQPIASISDELAVVRRFVKPADKIQIEMKTISTLLMVEEKSIAWDQIRKRWKTANTYWGEFASVGDNELKSVSSYFVRSKLELIRDSGKDLRSDIQSSIDDSKISDLKGEVDQAFEMMSHVNQVLLFYIDDFSAGFNDLSDYLNNSMSGPKKTELTSLQKEIESELNKAYPSKQ